MPIFETVLFGVRIAPTYYGAAYALGFLAGYWLLKRRGNVSEERLEDLLLWVFVGVLLGGRLGYVAFYDPSYYLAHPGEILSTWKGGMSFHGGVIGVVLAMAAYAKRYGESFLKTADEVTLALPIGIALGRVANYVNGELYGFAPYSGPFPMFVGGVAHFPSPLLEATLEGPLLGLILWRVSKNKPFDGAVATVFLGGYAALRIFAEFFRLPDAHIGYFFGSVTMGQILSFFMLDAAIAAFVLIRTLHARQKLQ